MNHVPPRSDLDFLMTPGRLADPPASAALPSRGAPELTSPSAADLLWEGGSGSS